jgi:hypothetical protein
VVRKSHGPKGPYGFDSRPWYKEGGFATFRPSAKKKSSYGALVYKLGRHPFTVEKAERYRYALLGLIR